MHLAERIRRVNPSSTLAMAAKANAKKAEGIRVIDFGLGQPELDAPEEAQEAAIAAIRSGYTRYTATAGSDELKEAILEKLHVENQLHYKKSEVIVSCGAKHSLYNIAQVLFDRGDEVIIPAPYWVTYPEQVRLNDAVPVFIKTREEDHFLITRDQLQAAITPRTKAIILNSPCNPTGAVYTQERLEEMADLLEPIWTISDEIYEHFVYEGARHISIAALSPKLKQKTLVVNGVSKSYSMTGFRIGYTAGPSEVIEAMTTLQSQTTSNPTSISQKAAIGALKAGGTFIREMVCEYDRRRRRMVEQLNTIPGVRCLVSPGSFYLFPNISALLGKRPGVQQASDLAEYLLEEAAVSTVAGEGFGMDGYLRLSYAVPYDIIREGMERIKEAILKL